MDIPIAQIISEYLKYLDLFQELNLSVAGDFGNGHNGDSNQSSDAAFVSFHEFILPMSTQKKLTITFLATLELIRLEQVQVA